MSLSLQLHYNPPVVRKAIFSREKRNCRIVRKNFTFLLNFEKHSLMDSHINNRHSLVRKLKLGFNSIDQIIVFQYGNVPESTTGGVVGVVCWLWSVFSFSSVSSWFFCSFTSSLSDCDPSPGNKRKFTF